MSKRVCLEPGCPTLTDRPRCHDHERAHDRARGTRQERGYDRRHELIRQSYAERMARGERFSCWRCRGPIDPESWDLGHDDLDRRVYRGPECTRCNRATAGR